MRKYLLLIPLLLFAGDYGTITGKVVDSKTGEPVGGALVVVEGLNHGANTNENGVYTLPFISAGTYTVSVTNWRYISKKYDNVIINANDTTILNVSLDYGPPPIIVSSHYPTYQYESSMIKGRVIDEVACNPIPNVTIVIEKIAFDTLGQPMLTIMNRSTNQNGEYSFDSVPIGTYKLTARIIGYQNYIHEKVTVRKNEKTVFDFSVFRYDTAGGEIQTVDELQCIVYPKKLTYYPGEPFIIVCTIRNLTKKPIRLCKYSNHGSARLEFTKVDSTVCCIAFFIGVCNFGEKPEKDDFIIIMKDNPLTKEFDYTGKIHEAGSYESSVYLVFQEKGNEYGFKAWTGSLKSNTINFEVKTVTDIKVELDKRINAWSKYIGKNLYLSDLTSNKYFQDIVDLGVPALPCMIEKMKEARCLFLSYAVRKITKKLFTPSEYKDPKSIVDHRLWAAMYIQWWEEGRRKTPYQFNSLYNEWKELKQSGDSEKAGEVYMNIYRLGIIALPFIIEKIESDDTALIPLIAMLTTGEIKRDATIEECIEWWNKHKEKWYIPIVDESKVE